MVQGFQNIEGGGSIGVNQTALKQAPVLPKKKKKSFHQHNLAGYIFISPWLIGFLLLTFWPIAQSFYLSFTDYTLLAPPEWSGMDNYKHLFENDTVFTKSLRVTFIFVVISVPLKLFFSLMVAILLNKNIRGMNFYRTAIYFPSLIGGSIAVAALWRNIFGAEGFLNKMLAWFGIEGLGWIADPRTALGTLILLNVWQFGSTMVIFLAGLKQIPRDLYESSSVDGANAFRKFWSITLPMLSPVMFFNLVLGIIGSFQTFTSAFIITKGGPVHSTYMYAMFLFEKAFKQYQMGYASALAWVLLIIIAVLTGLNFLASKYWVFYESDGGDTK